MRKKQCVDFYGEKLNIGDEVIPIVDEALVSGIGGIISKIKYSERYNNYYITITDNNGNILLENVDAGCYTTKERYNERENQEYVYSLTFFNKNLWPMTNVLLTNKTDINYEIPDETSFVTVVARHLKKKEISYSIFSSLNIFYLIIDNNLKVEHKDDDFYYLLNTDTYDFYPISNDYKFFKNIDELKKYIKEIIKYFNYSDLTYVNSDIEFHKNEKGKEFEKKLIHHLKH